MSNFLFGAAAVFAAGFVYFAICAPVIASRDPIALTVLAVGTVLLVMYFR